MRFDYFYGSESEQFTFYRIPKILITSPRFKKVSDGAKILYGLMLDRLGVSIKNGWVDDENRAFIYFKIENITDLMDCSPGKAVRLLAELDSKKGIGLIERIKQGQGKPTIIYVKKFMGDADDFSEEEIKTFQNRNSRVFENESADFQEQQCSNNNINNTEMNNIWMDRYSKTILDIKKQIGYNDLIVNYDSDIINNIVNIMADVFLLDGCEYKIEGKKIEKECVQQRFRQITYGNLSAFLIAFKSIYYKIKNPKTYLISALYNISLTAETALVNQVNYDMYGGGD